MENREEIKDGVKQRIIEFMAEQITNEESFINLKSELIEELFYKKETKKIEPEPAKNLDTFTNVASKAETSLQKLKERQAEHYKKIIDVKLGRNTNENVQKLIKELQDKDSTSYSDVIEQLDGKNIPEYKDFFTDPRLNGLLTKEKIDAFKVNSMAALKDSLLNPFSDNLSTRIQYHTHEDNYYKSYNVHDKEKDFKFDCSYIYNKNNNQKYIDKFQVDSKGFLLHGEELGIPFAIEAMELIDQAEVVRQKAIKTIERNAKRNSKVQESKSRARNKRK